ncbi:hypothetical protein [Bacillus canaveralius]|uniref:hypothetical protein n=2 Tax=Bacillus canaveralius TaxID=1403243 RepID=UPI00163B4FF7|nr:hypothetical protein [Bacillus canaveralius]
MEQGKDKVQKISGRNPDAAALGNPEVAAQVEVTTNDDEIRKGDGRYVPEIGESTKQL